jgi:hypothetical protein
VAELLGRNAFINVGGNLVGRMRSFSVTINGEQLDVTEFGSTWNESITGLLGFTISIEGMTDLASTEQGTLRTAAETGAKLTDIEFYVDSTGYYVVDLVADPASGVYISSYVSNVDNKNIVNFTMTLQGTGVLKFVT